MLRFITDGKSIFLPTTTTKLGIPLPTDIRDYLTPDGILIPQPLDDASILILEASGGGSSRYNRTVIGFDKILRATIVEVGKGTSTCATQRLEGRVTCDIHKFDEIGSVIPYLDSIDKLPSIPKVIRLINTYYSSYSEYVEYSLDDLLEQCKELSDADK